MRWLGSARLCLRSAAFSANGADEGITEFGAYRGPRKIQENPSLLWIARRRLL